MLKIEKGSSHGSFSVNPNWGCWG